jgi:hypothetical protein
VQLKDPAEEMCIISVINVNCKLRCEVLNTFTRVTLACPVFLERKRPEREDSRLFPSIAKVKNVWSYCCTSRIFLHCIHSGNSTFTFHLVLRFVPRVSRVCCAKEVSLKINILYLEICLF